MKDDGRRGEMPGGVLAPALVLAASTALFMVATADPELIDLGPHFSASGIGVLGMVAALFWLLAAIGLKRR